MSKERRKPTRLDWRSVWHRVYLRTGSMSAADAAVCADAVDAFDAAEPRHPRVERAWKVVGYVLA